MDPSVADPPRATRFRHGLTRAATPAALIAVLAILMLILIWAMTLNLIAVERSSARRTAVVSTHELAETYEAQVVRALREIDQTLKVVKYAHESRRDGNSLPDLEAKGLLPSNRLFVVSVVARDGRIVASTRASTAVRVVDPEDLRLQSLSDALRVSRTDRGSLQFSRRLDAADGAFDGMVTSLVAADYFVSGYDTAKLGSEGVLGLLGTDGVMRVRRTGETVSSGDAVDYASVVQVDAAQGTEPGVSANPWDGVRRYTSAQQLYDFPLAVIVGLSEEEQLAVALKRTRSYLWRAGAGSLLLILIAAWLRRLSTQLANTRQRVVEEQLAHAERVEYLAYHDGLTGLPNRSLFSKLLGQGIQEAQRYERQLAVMFLDLDRFKQVNDTLGHAAGDQLLCEVARRLRECVRDSDVVARLGGDEFVVLLPHMHDQQHAATVAQKILAATARPFLLAGQELRVIASIGISIHPDDGRDEQTLTKNADVAMYKAKEEGKNNFQFYSEKLNANSLERLALESALRHALERNEFQVHYQAKRDTRTGEISGMEALIRWEHPDLGTVAPMRFIHVAEEAGLIVPIGRWVLRTACLQNVAWQKEGLPRMSVSINLTARQFFHDELLPMVKSILDETGMDPRLLELEIHEGLLMRNVEETLGILTRLKSMSIRIAVDDFGIGYSSLSTLRQFPLDTIKIDRSFIRNLGDAAADKALTQAVISMGHTLSLTVVAQGVETKEQADFLREYSCDEFQGFLLNKPVAAEEMRELLRAQGGGKAD